MCVVFAYFCIPETKGLSLEQVDALYQTWTPGSVLRRRAGVSSVEEASDSSSIRGGGAEKEIQDVAEKEKDVGLWESVVKTVPVLTA